MSFQARLLICLLALGSVAPSFLLADDSSPDHQYYLDKGNLYVKEGKSQTAIKYYQEAIERNPYNVQARNNLGELYAKSNLIDEAMEQFDKALEVQHNYVPALNNKSYLYLQKRIYSQAILFARKAIQIDPESGSAHFNLGVAYLGLKQYANSASELKMAIRGYKDRAPVYEKLGDVYQAQTRHEEAIAYYRQALDVDSLDATARGKLGESYLALGDEKKAVEQFKYSADLAPTNIAAQYRLAEHYVDIRDWNNAKRLYLIILSIDNQQAKAHKALAMIYERDEQYGLALYHWQKYAEINPKDLEAADHIKTIRKPLLSKKQIDQLEMEKKMKESALQQAAPTADPSLAMPADNGNPPNPWDSNPSASVPVPTAVGGAPAAQPAAQVEQPVGVAPIDVGTTAPAAQPAAVVPVDTGNNAAPAAASAPAPSGLMAVGDAPTATPSQGNVPSLPK
jgi:tetratricopeptide (TPR) repeat protein